MNPMGGMRSMSVIAGPGGLSRSDCAVLPPPAGGGCRAATGVVMLPCAACL